LQEKEEILSEEIPKIGYSEGPDDGRFTIGGEGIRLMYGYPVPQSTSHFVVNIDGKFASNAPYLNLAQYISSTNVVKGDNGSLLFTTSYYYDSVKIIQKLIPVDKDFKPVTLNSYGQLYKIEYSFENISSKSKKIGLTCLIDFMIYNNDAAQSQINGKLISNETGYINKNVPDEVKTFYKNGDENAGTSWTVMNNGEAVKPDEYYVGRWSYLHGIYYDVKPDGNPYSDSGELLKWNLQALSSGDKRTICYYYGFPYNAKISAITNEKIEERQVTIFFKKGSSTISDDDRKIIKKIIDDNKSKIQGVLVSGYADAMGSEDANIKISKNRVISISNYLSKLEITESSIIPKAYGESEAMQTEETIKNGNKDDRKAIITIFIKVK